MREKSRPQQDLNNAFLLSKEKQVQQYIVALQQRRIAAKSHLLQASYAGLSLGDDFHEGRSFPPPARPLGGGRTVKVTPINFLASALDRTQNTIWCLFLVKLLLKKRYNGDLCRILVLLTLFVAR